MRRRRDDRPAGEASPRELDALVPVLAAEFPVYAFGTVWTSNGCSLSAQDRDRAVRPGVYAVITSDPGEMRRVLREADDRRPVPRPVLVARLGAAVSVLVRRAAFPGRPGQGDA